MESISIPVDPQTKRFAQGVSTGAMVREAHAEVDFPDKSAETAAFWFYCGAVATGDHGCKTSDDFSWFIQGASLRQP